MNLEPELERKLQNLFLDGQLQMLDIGLKGSPVSVIATTIDYGQGAEFVSGAGLKQDHAFKRCLFEYAERQSALVRPGDLLSADAMRGRARLSAQDILLATEPTGADGSAAGWAVATSLSGERQKVAVPAHCIFLNTALANQSDSNGLAAHATLDDAILAGLVELIERDAVAIWWYNRLRRPLLPTPFATDGRLALLVQWLAERNRLTYFLDLTSDIPVPVVGAFSMNEAGREIAYGFGAAPDHERAAEKALYELVRAELSIHFHATAKAGRQTGSLFGEWSVGAHISALPHFLPAETLAPPQLHGADDTSLDGLLGLLAEQGIQAYAADLTRPEIGIPVARVVAPGLRPWWSRLAPGRLFDVPVKMGWRRRRLARRHMNKEAILL